LSAIEIYRRPATLKLKRGGDANLIPNVVEIFRKMADKIFEESFLWADPFQSYIFDATAISLNAAQRLGH
jgi:hypothetical protein